MFWQLHSTTQQCLFWDTVSNWSLLELVIVVRNNYRNLTLRCVWEGVTKYSSSWKPESFCLSGSNYLWLRFNPHMKISFAERHSPIMIPEKAKIKAATNAEVTTDKTKENGRRTTGSAATGRRRRNYMFEIIFQEPLLCSQIFFCSLFCLFICCSLAWPVLRIYDFSSLIVSLTSINIKPLKQMVHYEWINMWTPWVWKQNHKKHGQEGWGGGKNIILSGLKCCYQSQITAKAGGGLQCIIS